MPWPFVPYLLDSETVAVVHNSWAQDTSGAPMVNPSSSITDPPLACSVVPGEVGDPEGLEIGFDRITNKVQYRVNFPRDVATKPRDFLLWTDENGTAHTLIVTGYAPVNNGTGRWRAMAIERP